MMAGCSSFVNVPERKVTFDDIISMSKAEVGGGVIKRQIAVTRSQFHLDQDDIIMLKNEGVADEVIEAMIDTDEEAQIADLEKSYSLYDYWFNYFDTFYPLYIYDYPRAPYLYYSWGPYANPIYRWSGTLGRYYRDFPVGLPRKLNKIKQIPGLMPENQYEKFPEKENTDLKK